LILDKPVHPFVLFTQDSVISVTREVNDIIKEQNMRFGDFIKKKRQDNPRQLTLKDLSERLGISLSFLSDIENNRRKPFDSDKIEKFAEILDLSDIEKATLYDLAAREKKEIPSDLEDIMMYEKIGEMARFALRQSNAGNLTEEDWKQLLRKIDERKRGKKP